jgi:sugar phosphate isomerase/epimerase
MKAAGRSRAQMKDRIKKFDALGITPAVELHLAGLDDILEGASDIKRNCLEYKDCEYIVHMPVTDARSGYIFDMYNDESFNLKRAFDLCNGIKSRTLVLHRCFGFDMGLDRFRSEKGFFEKVVKWDALAKEHGIKVLFENYGFVWLPEGLGKEFIVSALDHFFPWEIKAFSDNLHRYGLDNTGVLLDTAHMAISSNMFNVLKTLPGMKQDGRFKSICEDDLERTDWLKIKDFIFDLVGHFHISDSFVWGRADGTSDMRKFLYSEGLPVGKGNIDFDGIFKGITGDKMFIMEIEPEDGDYNNNVAQMEAVKNFMRMFGRRAGACV